MGQFDMLALLAQLSSKKYIRKLLEYAYLFKNKVYSFQEFMETPVSSQMPSDLQLDEKHAHQMIYALVQIVEQSEQLQWDQEQMLGLFPAEFDQQLAQTIVECLISISPFCDKITNREIGQADSLIDMDWRIDVQIQTHNQQKVNMPVLFLQLETVNSQSNEKNNVTFQLNQQEVSNFHKNLLKIKEQLASLTK